MSSSPSIDLLRRAGAGLDSYTVAVPALYALLLLLFVEHMLPGLNLALGLLVLLGFAAFLLQALRAWLRGDPDYGRSVVYHAGGSLALRGLLLMLAVIALWYGVFRELRPQALRDLLFTLCLAWLPAAAIVLAETESLLASLDPRSIARVMGTLGADYLRVLALGGGSLILGCELAGILDDRLGSLPAVYLILLSTAWAVALTGAAGARHAEALGVETAIAELELEPAEHELLREARWREREHDAASAHRWLREALRGKPAPLAVERAALELAARCGDTATVLREARPLARRALNEGDPGVALAVADQCLRLDATFLLGAPDQDLALLERARARGRSDLFVPLARSYCRRYREDARCPELALEAARILVERRDDVETARSLLDEVLATGPGAEPQRRLRAALSALPGERSPQP